MTEAEGTLLAIAMYVLRLLLAGGLGSQNDAPHEIRMASHLAYALHNDALAVIHGQAFDVEASLARITNIDRIIGGSDGEELSAKIRSRIAGTPTRPANSN